MTQEIWRSVAGFDGIYEISNAGRVRSVPRVVAVSGSVLRPYVRRVRERILRASPGEYGHLSVTLWREHVKTIARVHVLVLEAFVGPRPEGLYGCHDDGCASNNHLANLYWGTPKQNAADRVRHGTHQQGSQIPWAKFTEADVARIRSLKGRVSQSKLAAEYGVRQGHISRVMNGRQWRHVSMNTAEA